ncbi:MULTISPECIES: rhodanese-like domain-containing protein [unclassified Deinococcus]|uniref:rhodanese-like domain-containing protein n=1 Tax=unclassified Deinococcus TaxID=2623546 RepID=UPI000C1A845A|nr:MULTISPECIES: rhodanese-like domain-containing protein [unclassified Deinococcus]MCD0162779.1 rhodanese-like domain-containing protein [Deinococcus sp. 6YEL10]PIG97635.1 sulfurtransferase [Deinococcus sp. UR1]
MTPPDSRPAPLPDGVTLIDLRPEPLRRPLLSGLTAQPVRVVSLDDIETGAHGLTRDLGPLLVVCERGVRSALAARYLRADGLDADAYPGGVPALQEALRGP